MNFRVWGLRFTVFVSKFLGLEVVIVQNWDQHMGLSWSFHYNWGSGIHEKVDV